MSSKSILKLILTSLLLLWMIFIFMFSAQNADKSSKTSSGVVKKIASAVYPDFKEKSEAEKEEITEKLSYPVRKLAHFSIFFVLSVISYFAFATYNFFGLGIGRLISPIFCIIYAVTDEIHQLFVIGRSCEIKDMLIDSSGILLAFAILFLLDIKFSFSKRLGDTKNA